VGYGGVQWLKQPPHPCSRCESPISPMAKKKIQTWWKKFESGETKISNK
jgi:hypothetical protein